jgi:hypothetical protein
MTEPSVLSLHLDAGTRRKDNGTQPVENGLERVLAGGINLLSQDEIEFFNSVGPASGRGKTGKELNPITCCSCLTLRGVPWKPQEFIENWHQTQ